MKCPVCTASFESGDCPQCGFDSSEGRDSQQILKLRDEFKDKVSGYAPEKRVSLWDKWRPWAATLLGFIIFIFWLRACSSGGWRLW